MSLKDEDILAEAEVKGYPGLYLVGCHHRHITVFSQQVRAINLVKALLADQSSFASGTTMAVIGAGIAGLTAAVYAARHGAEVDVLEQAPRPLWLQDSCNNRWLHPHIYDWPEPGSLEPRTLVLPVLNWGAGSAREVAAQIREEWEHEVSTNARLRAPLYGQRVVAICPDPGRKRVRLYWSPSRDGINDRTTRSPAAKQEKEFRYVILAVGFGMEGGELGMVSYWNDADGLDDLHTNERILVSGQGDGALADLMRLCLREFRQDQIVRLIQDVDLVQIGEQLLAQERKGAGDPTSLNQFYRRLYVKDVIERLEGMRNKDYSIFLAGKGYLYATKSAILNRFIISQLQKLEGPPPFEEVPAVHTPITKRDDGKFLVTFTDDKTAEFDRVVLRHGPNPALKHFPEVWSAMGPRRQHWRETPQALDQTRIPIWEQPTSTTGATRDIQDLESYESSSDIWCLVLYPAETKINWRWVADGALTESKSGQVGRSLNNIPLVIPVTGALTDAETYCRTVRALCQADIAIVDVSGYDPGVLMLLGIRSVVRRGVTITSIDCEVNPRVWSELPFNLKEINLLSHRSEDKDRLVHIGEAIREGLTQLYRSPHYQDLPVYDYVRNLGSSYDDYLPVKKQERVLFLRPFTHPYQPDMWEFVKQRFKNALKEKEKMEPRLESIIDENSPRLVGQRLYEAIRRTDFCVVDFSHWRPNVFYELGVRLAVNRLGPICIINEDEKSGLSGTRESLLKLFRPFEYKFPGSTTPFTKAIEAFRQMQDSGPGEYRPNEAALAHDQTYRVVSQNFNLDQERFGDAVNDALTSSVDVAVGAGDDQQNIDSTLLFGRENATLARKIRDSALERLCAAWYYLDGREAPTLFSMYDVLDPQRRAVLERYRRISARLTVRLAGRTGERDRRLLETIEQNLRCMKKIADFDDLLREWEDLSRQELNDLSKDELHDYIEILQQLQDTLEELGGVDCGSLLERVRADRTSAERYR
jgi:hypothetical protein